MSSRKLFAKNNKQFGVMLNPLKGFTINSGSFKNNYKLTDVIVSLFKTFTIKPKLFNWNFKQFGVMLNPIKGFTIIEFLIVISIMAIAGTLVSTSYLSFERRQRIKNAALEIKSQIRLVQNNALTGYKGVRGIENDFCDDTSTLVGWYSLIDKTDNSLTKAGVCKAEDGSERSFALTEGFADETVNYSDLLLVGNDQEAILVLFQPINRGALYYNVDRNNDPPILAETFLGPDKKIITGNVAGGLNQSEIISFTVGDADDPDGTRYSIKIQSTGEINEYEL